MRNDAATKTSEWLPVAVSAVVALGINACVLLTLRFSAPRLHSDEHESNAVEISLASPHRNLPDESDAPLKEPEPFATPLVIQNNLPTELFAELQPDETKPNGLLDIEDGGSALKPDAKRSGGGGGDGADAIASGHVATDDRIWARLKWKPDPNAKEKAAGNESGRGTTVPGVLKTPGAGDGLGNGKDSGALASQGSGTGSGAGTNGSNTGQGLGKAPPLGVSRKPGVLSMNRGSYPAEARAAHHEGTVVLSVEVRPGGDVGKVEVRTSSGYSELDQSAVSAARGWVFTGALQDGKPVAFWYSIPYRFMLTEQ